MTSIVLKFLKDVAFVVVMIGSVLLFSHMATTFVSSIPVGTEHFNVLTNTSIASLSDTKMLRGSFFLGTGTVSDKMYFTYYEGETSFKLKRVPSDTTIIFMDEDDHPYITTITPMFRNAYSDGSFGNATREWRDLKYEFHVPNGTIVKEYNLNGE